MRGAAMHPTKSGQSQKRLLIEPIVVCLGRIVLQQQPRLLLGHVDRERMEDRRPRSIGFPLEDFVAKYEMITKLCRQQFGEEPMILMSISTLRTEHHLRGDRSPKLREGVLDSFPMSRSPSVRN